MFERNMRRSFLPDMKFHQMLLYLLSRLLQENLPEIHTILEKSDVSTPMYASPWILTIFASCFELGFVARIYDLIFFNSSDIILGVILALFEIHKLELIQLESFDEITEYLKFNITKIDAHKMEIILEKALTNDISRQLRDFQVEYSVLMDEIGHSHFHAESARLAQVENKNLRQQVEVSEAGVERLENIRHSQQQEILALHNQLQDEEVKVQVLAEFIHSINSSRLNIEIPTEVRRIIQHYDYQQQQQVSIRRKSSTRKMSNGGGKNLNVLMEQNESDQPFTSSSSSDEREDHSPLITPDPQPIVRRFQRNHSVPSLPSNVTPATLQRQYTSVDEIEQNITKLHDNDHPLSFANDINFTLKSMELRSIGPTNSFRKK